MDLPLSWALDFLFAHVAVFFVLISWIMEIYTSKENKISYIYKGTYLCDIHVYVKWLQKAEPQILCFHFIAAKYFI